jgi:hypothetical protein
MITGTDRVFYDEALAQREAAQAELERVREMLIWANRKLQPFSFSRQEDALKMDEIKLYLEHGL